MFEKCSWIFEGFCGAFDPLSKSPPSSWGAGSVNTYTWQLWVSSRPEVKLPPNVAKIRKVFFRFLTHFYVSSISCQVSDKQQISDGSHIMFYSALDPASGKLRDYCAVKRATPRSCMYGAIFGSEATKSPRNTTKCSFVCRDPRCMQCIETLLFSTLLWKAWGAESATFHWHQMASNQPSAEPLW